MLKLSLILNFKCVVEIFFSWKLLSQQYTHLLANQTQDYLNYLLVLQIIAM
jgi:hypothetical protein